MIFIVFLCSLYLFFGQIQCVEKLQEHFSWRVIDFEYASDKERKDAIQAQQYLPMNNLPVAIEVWRDKMFITVPRWRAGKYAPYKYRHLLIL